MHVNFNKEIRENSGNKISEEVVEHLSNNLPTGTHYILDNEDGTLIMVSDTEEMTLGGFTLADPEYWTNKLGFNPSEAQILSYSYNSQTSIPLKLEKEGYIQVNGKEMKTQDIILDPFDRIDYEIGCYIAYPPKFPPAKEMDVSGNGYKRVLMIQRIPNDSYNEIIWGTDDQDPLKISFKYSEKDQRLTFNCSTDLKYAKSIKDIVESIYIYNAFIDGNAFINGKSFPIAAGKFQDKKFDNDVVTFWDKTLEVEKVICEAFGLSFFPQAETVDTSTLYVIEELYQCLVKKNPFRRTKCIESLSGNLNDQNEDDLKKLIGESINYQFITNKTFELFGVKFDLESFNEFLNAVVKGYDLDGNRFTLYFSSDELYIRALESYVVTMDFISKEKMDQYVQDNRETLSDIFKNSKELKALFEIK